MISHSGLCDPALRTLNILDFVPTSPVLRLVPHTTTRSTTMADAASPPAPAFKKRTNKGSKMRKRPATPPPEQNSEDSDYTSSEDDSGLRVKRRKREGVKISSIGPREPQDFSKTTAFEADRTKIIAASDDATRTSNMAALSSAPETARAATRQQEEGVGSDGTYRGAAGYSNFLQKNPDSVSQSKVGPQKAASSNVRMVTITDFAPDVCKDYKQTGFCGFGDGCKFLHAREDYKQGWQLDKEWEKVGSKKDKPAAKGDDGDLDEEEKLLASIPFKCIICKEDYKRPVVTKCGHYFCEKCAMVRYMKEKKKGCANCGKDTGGTFNVGRKLEGILERKRKREEEIAKAKEEEAGGGE